MTLTLNGTVPVVIKQNPKHKKNPEVGLKETVYGPVILVEQTDAQSFGVNEEVRLHNLGSTLDAKGRQITLMDWGNAIIRSKKVAPSGYVITLTADLNLEGDFKKTEKKVTWLADQAASGRALLSVTLLDYDYLITKKKLEETDNVADFVTGVSEFPVAAWTDVGVRDLLEGDVMQFERKGYYRVDRTGEEMAFVRIPDGRAAGVASKFMGRGKGDERVMLSKGSSGLAVAIGTGMYQVKRYGEEGGEPETGMYKVSCVYGS